MRLAFGEPQSVPHYTARLPRGSLLDPGSGIFSLPDWCFTLPDLAVPLYRMYSHTGSGLLSYRMLTSGTPVKVLLDGTSGRVDSFST